jgi:hypothetical protein
MAAPESHNHLSIRERTSPQYVWAPTFQAQREGCELTPDQQKALEIRDLCIIIANTVTLLREDPQIKHNAFKEADALLMLHQGISRIRDLGITPATHAMETELDTPLKIAKFVAGQLLLIDVNSIPNIHHSTNPSPSGIAGEANWYLYDMSLKDTAVKEDLEIDLSEEAVWDNSLSLWNTLADIILDDSELSYEMPDDDYLNQIIRGDIQLDDRLKIKKTYPKKSGKGFFKLQIATDGIEIVETGKNGEFYDSAFVLGPGKTDGYIGFIENTFKGDHVNTDFALREATRIINAFRSSFL